MKKLRPTRLTCSLCRSRVGADAPSLMVKIDASLRPAGRYCAPCLEAMQAVDAVREFRGDDEIADGLLAVYRLGRGGPNPTLVLEAVERAHARRRRTVAGSGDYVACSA